MMTPAVRPLFSAFFVQNWYSHPLTWLTFIAFALVIGGTFVLLIAIPYCSGWAAKQSIRLDTEFHASRAAQRCITAGLVILVLVAVAIVVAHVASRVQSRPPQSTITVNNNVSR